MSTREQEMRRIIYKNKEWIKAHMLTDRELSVLRIMNAGRFSVRTSDLSRIEKTTLHNANAVLKRLMEKGYVTRKNIGDPSGGDKFLYTLIPALMGAGC